MPRPRQHKSRRAHYALLVNTAASGYRPKAVTDLIAAIKAKGQAYTLYEPDSAMGMLKQAQVAAGVRRANSTYTAPFQRGGKVTALVACGGDGTFNLVARAGLEAGLPVGCLPLGKMNNTARFIYGEPSGSKAIKTIVAGGYTQYDTGVAADIPFFCSVGIGFLTHLSLLLEERGAPKFGLGWSQLGAKAAAESPQIKTSIKVDAFRFDLRPLMVSVHLLPHAAGLPFCPAAVASDGQMEILFDSGTNAGHFSTYTRLTHKEKYLYGDDIRLFRGKMVTIQPLRGRRLYLDGELVDIPNENLEVKIGEKQLGVFQPKTGR